MKTFFGTIQGFGQPKNCRGGRASGLTTECWGRNFGVRVTLADYNGRTRAAIRLLRGSSTHAYNAKEELLGIWDEEQGQLKETE